MALCTALRKEDNNKRDSGTYYTKTETICKSKAKKQIRGELRTESYGEASKLSCKLKKRKPLQKQ